MLDYNKIIDRFKKCDILNPLIPYLKKFSDGTRGLIEVLTYKGVEDLGYLALNYYRNISTISPSYNIIRNMLPKGYNDWCRTHYDYVARELIHSINSSFYYGETEAASKEKDQTKITPREHIFPPKKVISGIYLEHKYFNFVYTPEFFFFLCILQSQTTTATVEENMDFKKDGTLRAYENHNVILVNGSNPIDIKEVLISYQYKEMLSVTDYQFIKDFENNKFPKHNETQKQIIKKYTKILANESFDNFRGLI
jgi:hypothetical protein